MSWEFERGRVYNRRKDLHAMFEGQRQGGIITPLDHDVVFIITGDEGLTNGYSDRWRPDGVFEYFGEGQVGDMSMRRGNSAIAYHVEHGDSLLMFKKVKDGLRYEGEFICETHHIERAPDRNGELRDAIVFELRPLEGIAEAVDSTPTSFLEIEELRTRAFLAAKSMPGKSLGVATVFERSKAIRDYVVARAQGKCEGCCQPAPFVRSDGSPYLEPHHIRRLSDGGPDDPRFVIALCPNCHRRAHHAQDRYGFNAALLKEMKTIEVA